MFGEPLIVVECRWMFLRFKQPTRHILHRRQCRLQHPSERRCLRESPIDQRCRREYPSDQLHLHRIRSQAKNP